MGGGLVILVAKAENEFRILRNYLKCDLWVYHIWKCLWVSLVLPPTNNKCDLLPYGMGPPQYCEELWMSINNRIILHSYWRQQSAIKGSTRNDIQKKIPKCMILRPLVPFELSTSKNLRIRHEILCKQIEILQTKALLKATTKT